MNIFIRSVVKGVGILYFMLKLSWNLSVITIVVLPIFALASDYFGSKYKNVSELVQDCLAQASSFAEQAISAVRTVRSFAAEREESNRYSELLEATCKQMKQQSGMIGRETS